ncbi:MAG: nucleotidyltransferase family protein [Ardenticatenales bacterium]|nr:nucleotidyltransferase family protein [Ardenticatenales bacterium]
MDKSAQNQQDILALLRSHFSQLAADFSVSRIGVFGSFAKGDFAETSDVDLVIEFDQPIGLRFIELVEQLEQLLGRKVDVLTPAGINGIRVKRVARDIAENVIYV